MKMAAKQLVEKIEEAKLPTEGWGVSGLNGEGKGYIYNSEGHGNMETYIHLGQIERYADLSDVVMDGTVIYFN